MTDTNSTVSVVGLFPVRITTTWTPALKARAKELLDQGYSKREIGDVLGVSRNSVIGMMHRAGWTSPRTSSDNAPPRTRKKSAGVKMSRPRSVTHTGRPRPLHNGPPVIRVEPVTFPVLENTTPVHLLDLEPHHCRWPGEFMFHCGAPRHERSTYCAYHHAIAWVKPRGRT